ncbi:hypothetical protein GQ464_006155 [Rhodocaloribacter litoris]|uniref:hypothetical protein n=1 Tax=Rhodocaloribacter litoris TaxID=2558931 RepID=UPI001E4E392C|nr:hypothetical protein [Rhodocaloribacter litoris]QXD16528.1 hypothetical protein GQ464_006155 [Rhodocaloribacter litoris]
MDERLHIVRHLYGEVEDAEELRRLLEDATLRAEYEALREVKSRLDRWPPARPDAAVLERVVAAAAHPERRAAPGGPRPDRGPRRAPRRAGRWIGAAATLAVLLGVGLAYLVAPVHGPTDPKPAPPAGEANAAARTPTAGVPLAADRTTRVPPVPESVAVGEAGAPVAAAQPAGTLAAAAQVAGPALAWDEADDVRRLHRRIASLRARNADLQWGEPAVPLEMLSGFAGTTPGLRQAGERGGYTPLRIPDQHP